MITPLNPQQPLPTCLGEQADLRVSMTGMLAVASLSGSGLAPTHVLWPSLAQSSRES